MRPSEPPRASASRLGFLAASSGVRGCVGGAQVADAVEHQQHDLAVVAVRELGEPARVEELITAAGAHATK